VKPFAMTTVAITDLLTRLLETDAYHLDRLHGGCVGEVYRVNIFEASPFESSVIVAKFTASEDASPEDATTAGTLDIEGKMLTYLVERSDLPVPKVYFASPSVLLMEWIEGKSEFNPAAQRHAAECLAKLHQVKADRFGLPFHTLIGGLVQPNTPTDTWLDFFREQRVFYMAKAAYQEELLPCDILLKLEKCCDHLDRWIVEPAYPALLHGDAWTTNILAHGGKIRGFLDPAIYYGHPEMELAFTTLFKTFDEPFFTHYQAINPIEEGFFELRKDLYNLYPLLVHVRLFGQSYINPILQTLKRLGL